MPMLTSRSALALGLLAAQSLLQTACLDVEPPPAATADQEATAHDTKSPSAQDQALSCYLDKSTCVEEPPSTLTEVCGGVDLRIERLDHVPFEDDFPKDDRNQPTQDWRTFSNKPYHAWSILGGEEGVRDLFKTIASQVCHTLYRSPEEVKIDFSKPVVLSFQPNRNSIAWFLERDHEYRIVLSTLSKHVDDYQRTKKDIKGILAHEVTHLFQYDDADGHDASWSLPDDERLIDQAQRSRMFEGLADFARTQTGWVRDFAPSRVDEDTLIPWGSPTIELDENNKKHVKIRGPVYQDLGWFFTWLEHRIPGVAYKLNQSMSSHDDRAWSFDVFKDPSIAGRSVESLWDQYGDWANQPSCDECGPDQFCETLIPEQCGRNDLGMARCVDKPAFCISSIEPVCGCDFKTYNNECEAARAGQSLLARTDCESFAKGLRPPES